MKTSKLKKKLCFFRNLEETQQKCDVIAQEMKTKDMQICDLQQRVDNSEGCKLRNIYCKYSNILYQLAYELFNYIVTLFGDG